MEHATVSLTTVLTIVLGLLAAGSTVASVLLRITFNTYKANADERHERLNVEIKKLEDAAGADERELKREVRSLNEANHALEKTCLKLEGEVKLLAANHDTTREDLASIKQNMITKTEFEPRMSQMERMLTTILHEVQRTQRYPSSASHAAVMSQGSVSRAPIPRIDTPSKGGIVR